MSKWTEAERTAYRRMVGMLIKGDKQRKADYDARAARILATMREQLPDADDETLIEFSSTLCYTGGSLLKATVEEAAPLARNIHEVYAVITAQLMGVYDPADPEPPNQDVTDMLAMLGLDDDAIKQIRDMVRKESAADGGARQTYTGMYL